jgi:hypothetical protein
MHITTEAPEAMSTFEKMSRVTYALERINRVGWTPGTNRIDYKTESPGCMVGSCITDSEFQAAGFAGTFLDSTPWFSTVLHAANTALNKVFGEMQRFLGELAEQVTLEDGTKLARLGTAWNDAPGRTQAEVVAFLEKVKEQLTVTHEKEQNALNAHWAETHPATKPTD